MKTHCLKIVFIIFSFFALQLTQPISIHAQDLTISGNGSNSNSNIQSSQSSETNIQQSNNQQTENTVTNSGNTGDNQSLDNTASSNTVATGNSNSETTIQNSGNTQEVHTSPSSSQNSSTNATISGNGSNSQNSISSYNLTQTNISSSNNSNISNNIYNNSITGNNYTKNNTGGNVSIFTGDSNSWTDISNGPINTNQVNIAKNILNPLLVNLSILGNGFESVNKIDVEQNCQISIVQKNFVDLTNKVKSEGVTGNNSASSNTGGETFVTSGSVITNNALTNSPINTSFSTVNENCLIASAITPPSPTPSPSPSPITNPTNPPTTTTTTSEGPSSQGGTGSTSTSSISSSQPGAGEVLGAAFLGILPETGGGDLLNTILWAIEALLIGFLIKINEKNITQWFNQKILKPFSFST